MVARNDRVKLLVVGAEGVGKSALTVRFLTGRYIGTYNSNKDIIYKTAVCVSDEDKENSRQIKMEINDTTRGNAAPTDYPTDRDVLDLHKLNWANGVVIVYSVTDGSSFLYATRLLTTIRASRPDVPCILIGNKCDLSHARSVDEMDARFVADSSMCRYDELSAATQPHEVSFALTEFAQCIAPRVGNDKSSQRIRRWSIVDIARSVFRPNRSDKLVSV